jgi:hypothetical protein
VFAGCARSGGGTTTEGTTTEGTDLGGPDLKEDIDPGLQKGGSYYSLEIVLPSGLLQTFEKQLDEKDTALAFGSSHIAPAVSLAIEDTFTKPFATVTFNFGFVVGSNDFAVTIEDEGKWAWGQAENNAPPGFKIELKDQGVPRRMVSWKEGAEGHYLITKWGVSTGEIVQGKIKGTLVDESYNGDDGPKAGTVNGEFRLILPERGT